MTATGVISVVLLVAGLVIVVGSCAGMAVEARHFRGQ